jgi:hypothetical protein
MLLGLDTQNFVAGHHMALSRDQQTPGCHWGACGADGAGVENILLGQGQALVRTDFGLDTGMLSDSHKGQQVHWKAVRTDLVLD